MVRVDIEQSPANSRSPFPTTVFLMAALASLGAIAHACDDTLMLSSGGLIITNQTTKTYHTGLAVLHTGSTLCFSYPSGETEQLKLVSINKFKDFEPIYRACSFNITTTSIARCLGADECWDNSTCHNGYVKTELIGTNDSIQKALIMAVP